jgi:hypothetical protein
VWACLCVCVRACVSRRAASPRRDPTAGGQSHQQVPVCAGERHRCPCRHNLPRVRWLRPCVSPAVAPPDKAKTLCCMGATALRARAPCAPFDVRLLACALRPVGWTALTLRRTAPPVPRSFPGGTPSSPAFCRCSAVWGTPHFTFDFRSHVCRPLTLWRARSQRLAVLCLRTCLDSRASVAPPA